MHMLSPTRTLNVKGNVLYLATRVEAIFQTMHIKSNNFARQASLGTVQAIKSGNWLPQPISENPNA
jgi:hypothetical protein